MEIRSLFLSACGVPHSRKYFEIIKSKGYKREITKDKRAFVYGLVDNDKIIYIGCSTNLRARLAGHNKKPFQKVVYIEFYSHALALIAEKRAIQKTTPSLNRAYLHAHWNTEERKRQEKLMEERGYVRKWEKVSSNCYSGMWIHVETGLSYNEHMKLESILKEETINKHNHESNLS